MPFYKVPGFGVVHMKIAGHHRPPAPCSATVGISVRQAEPERCGQCSEFLCDWPTGARKTCSAPLCEAHANQVGPDRHYCPDHFANHSHQHPQRSLFGFLNEAD